MKGQCRPMTADAGHGPNGVPAMFSIARQQRRFARFFVVSALAVAAASCGSDAAAPLVPTQIKIKSGASQTATAGTEVSTKPSVTVLDANDTPVSDVAVVFAVVTGGGS